MKDKTKFLSPQELRARIGERLDAMVFPASVKTLPDPDTYRNGLVVGVAASAQMQRPNPAEGPLQVWLEFENDGSLHVTASARKLRREWRALSLERANAFLHGMQAGFHYRFFGDDGWPVHHRTSFQIYRKLYCHTEEALAALRVGGFPRLREWLMAPPDPLAKTLVGDLKRLQTLCQRLGLRSPRSVGRPAKN